MMCQFAAFSMKNKRGEREIYFFRLLKCLSLFRYLGSMNNNSVAHSILILFFKKKCADICQACRIQRQLLSCQAAA